MEDFKEKEKSIQYSNTGAVAQGAWSIARRARQWGTLSQLEGGEVALTHSNIC